MANQHHCEAFSTLEELFAASDAVVVAAPTSQHHPVAAAALDAGCHVLVEKPLAISLVEADDLIARADAAGRFLAVGHVERFNPVVRACRHLMDDPRFLTCIRLARFQPRGTDVGVTLDLMIHDIDLVLGLVDSPVKSFEAIGIPLITDTVDMANARLTFENGAIADVSASRASMQPTRELRVFQESGYFSLDLAAGRGEFHRRRLPPPRLEDPATASLADFVERMVIEGDGGEPLRAELEAFVAGVNGLPSDVVTGREGREALEVALNISREIERYHHATAQHS
ncbi:MAG: Gfo/Idh/MocA family oxidoreductase [Gemmatimonadales bacterium]|nr:MAG: Gfo/Idh/MocA family oxidoreductase [Gemmatimonadales bacterium]